MEFIRAVISFVILSTLISCSATKGLKDSDKLFEGTTIEIIDEENVSDRNTLFNEIRLSYLKSNTPGILNIKTGFYNLFDSTGTNKIKNGIKNKMGSAPVLFQNSLVRKTRQRLKTLLRGSGYLRSEVVCDTTDHNRRVKINCDITLNQRYKIDSIFYPFDTLPITQVLRPMYSIDFLKPGEYIQRKNIIKDRDAFIQAAHNNGYPFVNNDDVIFIIDTTVGNNLVDVHFKLLPTTDSTKYERYRYGSIYVNPNFSLEKDAPTDTSKMIKLEKFHITEGYDFLKEKTLNKAIYIEKGIIYNQSRSRITTNRFIDFGIFKFVNVKTRVNPDFTLDQFFNLSTLKMESISGELEINNRPGNFWGVLGKVSYLNKNLFRGAERFETSLSFGIEKQFGKGLGVNTSDLTFETSLAIPAIGLFKTNKNFVPRTFVSLLLNQQINERLFSIRKINTKLGLKWNETEYKSSFAVPLDIQMSVLSNKTLAFDTLLMNEPRLEESYKTALSIGFSYDYIFNKRNKYNPINQFYFKGSIDGAGTGLTSFINWVSNNKSGEILGVPYTQFIRFTADVRKYWALPIGSFASRMVVGAGFAFKNSDELPYSKQYSVGGANDLRAFGLRRIGPGTSIPADSSGFANQFIDQTGDLKIATNLEYRFPLIGYLKGAVFLDAGNVWLINNNPTKSDGLFEFSNFYKEIAVGTGFGFRIDLDYILLRTDIAFPIRNINDQGKFTWVIDEIDILEKSWRTDNVAIHFSLGYPF